MTKKPMLPSGEPKPVAPIVMKNLEEIVKGLKGFVSHWRLLCAEDSSREYRRKHEYLLSYWTKVLDALPLEILPRHVLHDGFWPRTQITPGIDHLFNDLGEIREEFGRDEHFIGRRFIRFLVDS